MINFKKHLLLIFVFGALVMFSSCNRNTETKTTKEHIPSVENCEFNLATLQGETRFNGDVLNDERIATQYANLILENTLEKNVHDYKLSTLSLDSDDGTWIVSYCKVNGEVGGDINIALSKETGEVRIIWFGE